MTEAGDTKPKEEFLEFNRDFDVDITGDKELWLIHWPLHSTPEIDGQAISLKVNNDGLLGTVENSTGKRYELVSYKSQTPEATVFLPSSSGSKIVGKISREVSVVHYPDPNEISERTVIKRMAERSAASTLTNSANRYSTPTQGTRSRSSRPSTSSMRSSRDRAEASRRHEPVRSIDLSTQDSGKEHSAVTSTGSLEQSQEGKSKKRKKN
ncbi:OLC1v1015588C1 [Oldenlandia corymbosa var. corymbosa]|uniref:OLC1v1015588C1 n=1 Tax=Oldenlandia corymbosa var. corymbosa TaxID=529605 RepID=A0AAV1E3I4_OLDCO|nr:OLC1v1015588C1 [Oldenlandia corymbosa var. corymbosa]